MLPAAHADERPVKPASAAVAAKSAETGKPTKEHVEQLIRDLGSPHYTTRRAASIELRQIGAEAFDMLFAATDAPDPEVAASANYLLRQIPVRWIQADDPPAVRSVMRQFARESEASRRKRVEQLDRLSGDGTKALCRIARYDRSPLVSRAAALAIIRPSQKPGRQSRPEPQVVEQELGSSTRVSATWLRQYLAQLRDPASSVPAWKQLIAQESARFDKNSGETSNDIVLGLLWNAAELYRQIGERQELNAALDRMMGLASGGSDETLIDLLAWLTENKSWDVLDAFLTRHQSRLEQSKRTLYYAALARDKQGNRELAEELAAKAAALPAQPTMPLEGFLAAKDLEERRQFDWAVREYRRATEKQSADSIENILSRIHLASLLHDYAHEKEAAEALEPLVKAVNADGRMGLIYAKSREYYADRIELPTPEAVAARYRFYRAGQFQHEKDWKRARQELDLAIRFDPTDADVLIAMYRLPEVDPEWRASVVEQIKKLAQKLQQEIEESPSDASPYNQWAWLISNTEGDYQQAIRYSHRSLELNTHGESGAASFLDTLGRCYYAAGDYEKAVKYERQAIAKVDHMQVMHRQLALFEKALAEKKAAAPSPEPKSK
jgi:tetratricopeptide (TPR) repeat protein